MHELKSIIEYFDEHPYPIMGLLIGCLIELYMKDRKEEE